MTRFLRTPAVLPTGELDPGKPEILINLDHLQHAIWDGSHKGGYLQLVLVSGLIVKVYGSDAQRLRAELQEQPQGSAAGQGEGAEKAGAEQGGAGCTCGAWYAPPEARRCHALGCPAGQGEGSAEMAKRFNLVYPVGTPVRYWLVDREGPGTFSRTRSVAMVALAGFAAVQVEGYDGWIPLGRVQPVGPMGGQGADQAQGDALHAERLAALADDLGELQGAVNNLHELDPTDQQSNELRVVRGAVARLQGTLRGLGLVAPDSVTAEQQGGEGQ